MNTPDAPVLNPAWEHIFAPPLVPTWNQDAQSRVANWIKSIALPHIAKNPKDFCIKVFVSDVRVEVETRGVSVMGGQTMQYAAGKLSYQLEVFANSGDLRRSGISPAVMNDPWITSLNMTYDNFDRYTGSPGWLSNHDNRYQYRESHDTRISIDLVGHDNMKALMPGQPMWLFMGHSLLSDVRDWLTTAAHIPLNPTKLPWKEAVRLSAKWHDDEAKRRQKAALRKITRGSRVPLGKLQVASGSLTIGEKYEVFWLTDKPALEYETVLQHHCVWSYWDQVRSLRCAILHVRNIDPEKEQDRWTVDVRPLTWAHKDNVTLRVVQMRGVVNRDPHPEFPQAINNMLELGSCPSVFTKDSFLDRQSLLTHFTLPPGVKHAFP